MGVRGVLLASVPVVAWISQAMAADSAEESAIADRFRRLTRESNWRKAEELKLNFRTYHPQGMAVVGDRFFLSSVEVIDRGEGRGVGHLFEVDFRGNLLRQARLGEGPMYHPGGIDFDGRQLWVPVAEYRPNSRTVVYAVNPESLEIRRVFEFGDHLGALVCDDARRGLVGVSWGSRRFYRWDLREDGESPVQATAPVQWDNGSHYVDYQDGQFLQGTPWALFGGISRMGGDGAGSFALGGIELVDVWEMRVIHQLPVMVRAAGGASLLRNPFAVEGRGTGLRFYFVPEDESSRLHVYDVE
jgi:hypothetical protein